MTFDYAAMAATAKTLIAEFGQTITIKRHSEKTTDPVTGDVTYDGVPWPTEYTPKGVLRPFPDNLVDETRILTGDRELVLDDTVEPLMDDQVTIDGEDWTIQRIITTEPAGTPLVYRVQVRK